MKYDFQLKVSRPLGLYKHNFEFIPRPHENLYLIAQTMPSFVKMEIRFSQILDTLTRVCLPFIPYQNLSQVLSLMS